MPYYSAAEVMEWFIDVHHLPAWLKYSTQEGGSTPPAGVDDDLALPWEVPRIVPLSLELQGHLVLTAWSSFMPWTGWGWGSSFEINERGHTAVNNQHFEQLLHHSKIYHLYFILIDLSFWPACLDQLWSFTFTTPSLLVMVQLSNYNCNTLHYCRHWTQLIRLAGIKHNKGEG